MKKIFLTLLIFSINLTTYAKPNYSYTVNQTPVQTQYNTQGVYVNEEITTPITQIGLPEEYTQPEIIEQGLEIIWNDWHAQVGNQMLKHLNRTTMPKNFIIKLYFTVDINKNISNIIIIYIPESTFVKENNTEYLGQNSVLYMYQHDSNKFYKLKYLASNVLLRNNYIDKVLNNSTRTEISFGRAPYGETLPKLSERVKKFSGNKHLKFPPKTKRKSVVVKLGFTDIDYMRDGYYESSDFNDVEKQ